MVHCVHSGDHTSPCRIAPDELVVVGRCGCVKCSCEAISRQAAAVRTVTGNGNALQGFLHSWIADGLKMKVLKRVDEVVASLAKTQRGGRVRVFVTGAPPMHPIKILHARNTPQLRAQGPPQYGSQHRAHNTHADDLCICTELGDINIVVTASIIGLWPT